MRIVSSVLMLMGVEIIYSGGESPEVPDNVLVDTSACQQAEHGGEYGVRC